MSEQNNKPTVGCISFGPQMPKGDYFHESVIAVKDAEIAELSRHHAAEMLGHADAEREVERLNDRIAGLESHIAEANRLASIATSESVSKSIDIQKLTARNTELAAEVERLKEKHRNDEQLWTTRYETTYDELAEARKVIERLPKTADGVPITPNMRVVCQFKHLVEGTAFKHSPDRVHVHYDKPINLVDDGYVPAEESDPSLRVVYSTREAALAAKPEAQR